MKKRILVLGAGFGGLELCTMLSEAFGDGIGPAARKRRFIAARLHASLNTSARWDQSPQTTR